MADSQPITAISFLITTIEQRTAVLAVRCCLKATSTMNNTNSSNRYIIQQIRAAAHIYKTSLAGRTFLYVFDKRYIEVIFKTDSFRHLTGVTTSLSAKRFYDDACHNRLQPSQISFSSVHPRSLCLRKIKHICDIASLMTSECFMLEEIGTTTRTFQFGATNLQFTICLDQPQYTSKARGNTLYVPESLRDEDCFARSREVYAVSYIFSKPNNMRQYDTLVYRDQDATLQDLESEIIRMLTPELISKCQACV